MFKTVIDSKGLKVFTYKMHLLLVVSANNPIRDLLRSQGTLP